MTGGNEVVQSWAGAGVVAAAACLSAVLIVALRPLLQRYALARPNARSSHRMPTAQGGGLAVIAATILVGIAGSAALGAMTPAAASFSILMAATVLLAIVGGIDDLRPMPILPRLLLQGLAILATLAALPPEMRALAWLPWWIERIALFVGLLWFINLTNFMDGIDWMTVAEVVPATAAIALIGMLGLLPLAVPATVTALALLGAMLGFAPFNKPVAKLFLGDVGSLPIGLLLGWLLVQLATGGAPTAALLLPLYYLADATITLARRMAAGESFWQAHRTHFYQRAGDAGLSVPTIVGRVLATNVALAALAVVTIIHPGASVEAASLGAGAILVGLLLTSFLRGQP